MNKLARWTVATAVAALAAAAPANASFLQELGSPFTLGAAPYGVITADFNHDGRSDIIGINGQANSASLLLRQAAGGFAAEAPTPLVIGANFGAVADFNGDGFPDFAATGFNNPGGGLSVKLRKPAGGFLDASGTPITTPNLLTAVATGDFGGDARPDIAVAKGAGGLNIYVQQVNGTFVADPVSPPTGAAPRYIATADFNRDGRADLAVTNANSANVTILLQKAGGGFTQEIGSPVPVGASPQTVDAKDFNGDTLPDLAVTNAGASSVSVLLRVPAGGFTPMTGSPFSVESLPVGVVGTDFNADGLMDMAVTNQKSNTVSILLQQAAGGFANEPGTPIPTGAGPYGIASADFNDDSKPDLAIANNGAGNLTVLLNTTAPPVVSTPPTTQTPVVNPAPVVNTPTPAPRINARLTLAWTVFRNYVALDSATLKDLPAGATVKITCSTCKTKSLTLTSKKSTLTLSKLRGAKLKRGKTFTVTITKPGYVGLSMTRKVKNYGRTLKAMKKAVKAPFSETRGCVPVGATKPAKTC